MRTKFIIATFFDSYYGKFLVIIIVINVIYGRTSAVHIIIMIVQTSS